MNSKQAQRDDAQPPERRSFLVRFSAAILSILALSAPFAAGWGVAFHPLLRRKKSLPDGAPGADDSFIRVGPLDLLPADGTPRSFVLTADRSDAWTRIKNQRLGTIYLSRDDSGGEARVTAFSATCPHLGCVVDFDAAAKRFACPCHEAAFAVDGSRVSGPSKRGLDELDVEVRDGVGGAKDIYVAYQRYLPGTAERTPIS